MEQVYLDYAATHPCFTREILWEVYLRKDDLK